jgi:hypothetical protein
MSEPEREVLILWTSKDIDVAMNMVFLYAENSKLKGWWDDVSLLVWGPSAFTLANDTELQENLRDLQAAGVKVFACRRCAENYGVVEKLESMDIEVFYAGKFLSDWVQADRKLLTF